MDADNIYRSTDDGLTWTIVFTKVSSTIFVKMVDMGTGIWLAYGGAAGSSGREVYRSIDGGTTWELVYGDGEGVASGRVPPDYHFIGDGCEYHITI